MNDNPEGTPNPLNPAVDAGNGAEATGTGALDFVETELASESIEETTPTKTTVEESNLIETVKPASFAEPASTGPVPISSAMPKMAKPAPDSAMPEMKTVSPSSRFNSPAIDPMMRPRGNNNSNILNTKEDMNDKIPFDEVTEDIVASSIPTNQPAANFVAKDSIVGSSRNKKKPFIIAAIIFIIIAILCGTAAVAMFVLKNNGSGDRVSKAVAKLLNGETSNIINAKGNISISSDTAPVSFYNIEFDGTFDTATSMNKVSANVNGELMNGAEAAITIDELQDKDGDVFFKIGGLTSLMNQPALMVDTTTDCVNGGDEVDCVKETTTETTTNCLDGDPYTNCGSSESSESVSTQNILSLYSGMFEAIDDQWILASSDFSEEMEGLSLFNNSSACIVNTISALSKYGKKLADSYRENQFITYSTDNLEISKKKDALYKIGFDADKLASFINSLSNKGFMNELNACVGNIAINTDVTGEMVQSVLGNFPTVYVEVDDNNNFTRAYFKSEAKSDDGAPTTVIADLAISYPSKIEITQPESYVDMSTLLSNAMVDLLDQ